jgi:hypothetical protein
MKRLLFAATAALLASSALAQTYRDSGGTIVPGYVPVGGDGSGALFTGGNPGHVSGTFSASLSGFQPAASYSQLSVSTSSARVALPSGTTVVVYNTGSNDAYVTLGNSSVTATTAGDVVKAGGWMAFTIPTGATNIAGITASGTTALNISGGAGLPTGSTGTGGGGSGGTVAQGSAATAATAWWDQLSQGGAAVSASNGLYIQPATGAVFNLGTLNGAATAANQTSVIGSFTGGTAATNSEAVGGVYNSTLPTLTNGQQAAEQLDANGRQIETLQAPVANGWTPLLENGLTTTVKSVKSSGGQLGMLQCYNPNSTQAYVQVFNVASGSVTLGTTTPLQSYAIAPSSTGGLAMSSVGVQFSTAISIAATTTAIGSTAPATAIDCNVAYN